jgi:serine/threonine-protein kinase
MSDVLDRLRVALSARYQVERELGRGGMATVFLAKDVKHHRTVAIKVLRPELAAALGPERFLREIAVAAPLAHPHILPLYDSGEANGLLYYVMPYVEGESLRDRVNRERQLPLDDALQIAGEVADALGYAHSRNVVHRDIKPENILLEAGHAVVSDFGIARAITAAAGEERVTATGIAVGTPAYMSPEQASGDPHIDGRSDIYSLACVLYEMLGGEPPHTGATPQAILARQLVGEVRSLVPLRSSVTPLLDGVIRRALGPTAPDRYPSAQAFAKALADAHRASRPQVVRLPRRRMAVGGAVAGLVLIGAWLLTRALGDGDVRDDRLGLAVFPFRASGDRARDWSEALPDFLATALDGTPELRIADPWSLWRPLRPQRSAPAETPDPPEAERLAGRARAQRFLLGSVVQTRDRLDLIVRIYRAGRPGPLYTFAAAGSADSLPALVQRIAVEVIARLWDRDRPPSAARVEQYATRSADALKAYLQAKAAMRRGVVDSADAAIDRALALDSTFALALVAAGSIKSWSQFMRGQPYTGLVALAERAVRHSDSLSERNRLRARAMLASVRTDGAAAAEALGRIIQLDSTDLEAWDLLSYCHLVYGWQYGKGERDAREAAERVLQLDPTYVPGLVRSAYQAAVAEDHDLVRREVERLRHADTTTSLVRGALWSLRAVLASDAEFSPLVNTIARASPPEWIAVLRQLRITRPDRAEVLLKRVERVAGPGFPKRAATGAAAQLAVAQGRLQEVDSLIRGGAYSQFGAFERQLDLGLVASSIAGITEPEVARRAVASLSAYVPAESALVYFESRPVWSMGWAIAAYHALFGDTVITRQWETVIGTLPPGGTEGDYRGSLRSDLEARLALRRGHLRDALGFAARALRLWTNHANTTLEFQPEPAMRLQVALLLRETGRVDSAAALLRSLVPPTTWMGFLTARASVELGELNEGRGDRTAAARSYARALALWNRGGPEVAAWRARARDGLQRATGEPRTEPP